METQKMSAIELTTVECVRKMERACAQLPWESREAYSEWLAQTYFYVRHATRVLAKAAWKCGMEEEFLHKQLLNGINEEKNHEIMAIKDLETLGLNIEDFSENAETSAYYQTLYHLIDVNGPFELLGYFVTLEGLGAIGSEGLYNRILKSHGPDAATFIKVHAHLDSRHFDEGLALLRTLNEKQTEAVKHGLSISTTLYCNLIQAICDKHRSLSAIAS